MAQKFVTVRVKKLCGSMHSFCFTSAVLLVLVLCLRRGSLIMPESI